MVEAADDICYEIMDIEDSHKLKILSFEETANLLLGFFDEETQQKIRQRILDEGLTDENEQVVYMRACVIGKLENECVNVFLNHEEEILGGTFEGCLIEHIAEPQRQAFGLQDHGYADGGIHRCRRESIPLLLQATPEKGKQPVRHRERESGGANHGDIGLHQWHDGYLCARHLSENQRNKSADSIETKQAYGL